MGVQCQTRNDLYICSFACAKDEYVSKNGLLSQWRGYGVRGGVALVLNTRVMEDLIFKEHESFDYAYLGMFDVVYDSDETKVEKEIVPAIDLYAGYLGDLLKNLFLRMEEPNPAEAYDAFHTCISRFKHQGFQEEREVRIMAGPQRHTDKFIDAMKRSNKKCKGEKPVLLRERNGQLVPYIELFGNTTITAAVERIIVGPSASKTATADALRHHLGERGIKVEVSAIPYV